jgi:uridine kinase
MRKSPFIIGVTGGTASGKTTVTKAIVRSLNNREVVVIQHDSYYRDQSHLSAIERERINYDHPDALETELLVKHLKELKSGRKVGIPIYSFSTHT